MLINKSNTPKVVRVLPDVPAIGREFDYQIPEAWHRGGQARLVAVGSMVRFELHGRRVAGWVTDLDPPLDPDLALQPLGQLVGVGPSADIIDLARWAARRWVGPLSTLFRVASPRTTISSIPSACPSRAKELPDVKLVQQAFTGDGAIVRLSPVGDRWPFIVGAVALGNALILVPSVEQASIIASRLEQRGVAVASHPRDWAAAAAGATVVGTRAAAFAPVNELAAVLIVDEHDEVYQEERAPTWHAREVVFERAKRASVPCVLTSPVPSSVARVQLPLLAANLEEEIAGWPLVRVIDPRDDEFARGSLWTRASVQVLRDCGGRASVILNRKGRSRLLACAMCDELAICNQCDGALRQESETEFFCSLHGHRRPVVCAHCGATKFKNLRIGVSRAREELEVLLGEPVVEVTAETADADLSDARVIVGTEAALHRVGQMSAVIFADFDQELAAPRYRAAEEALALIVRAGRLVGGRRDGRGPVLIQTRQPGHPVLVAAANADIERWAVGELARRRTLGYPPYAAIAHISGAAAPEFIKRLGQASDLEIQGPVDGKWLVRATDVTVLSDILSSVHRPKGRLRVAVDPLRIK